MKLEDIKQFINENKEDEGVQEFLDSFKGEPEVNLDVIKAQIDKDDNVRAFIDSLKDKHTGKALETWKANNLEALINNEVKKRFPQKDDRDIELQALQQKFEDLERASNHEKLRNIAFKTASERGIPSDLVDFFVGVDEESTLTNLGKLEEVFNASLESSIKNKFKEGSYVPPKTDSKRAFTTDDLANMTPEQINEFYDSNK